MPVNCTNLTMVKFPAIYIDNDEGSVSIGVTGYLVKECSLVSAKSKHEQYYYDSENKLYLSDHYIIQGEYDDVGNPFVKVKHGLTEIHDFKHSNVLENILSNLKNDPHDIYGNTDKLIASLKNTKSAVEIINIEENS